MAGKMCPQCGRATFFESQTGRKCTNCGYIMIIPANDGKGGMGRKCTNCGKFMVFNNVCRNCGVKYKQG